MELADILSRDYSIKSNYKIIDNGKSITLEELEAKPGNYEIVPEPKIPNDCYVKTKFGKVEYKGSTVIISSMLVTHISVFKYTDEVKDYIYSLTRPIDVKFAKLKGVLDEAYELCEDNPNVRLIIEFNNSKDCVKELRKLIMQDKDFLKHTNLDIVELNKLLNVFPSRRYGKVARG